jgi:hypothetical protein
MGILSRFLTKYHQLLDRRQAKSIRRRQFNMTIDAELILGVKFLAEALKVPRYVVTEHLLQVGFYHMYPALQDLAKRKELEKHLVEVHLLGSELLDDEDILRL